MTSIATMTRRAEKTLKASMQRRQANEQAKCNAQKPCYLCPSCHRITTHRDSDGNSLLVEFSCEKTHEVLAQGIPVLEESTFKYFDCPIAIS